MKHLVTTVIAVRFDGNSIIINYKNGEFNIAGFQLHPCFCVSTRP